MSMSSVQDLNVTFVRSGSRLEDSPTGGARYMAMLVTALREECGVRVVHTWETADTTTLPRTSIGRMLRDRSRLRREPPPGDILVLDIRAACLLRRVPGTKWIVLVHHLDFSKRWSPRTWLWRQMARTAFRKADVTVTVSQYWKRAVERSKHWILDTGC